MIEILSESHDNILGIKAKDVVTDQDYKETLIPEMNSILEKYDRANFLYYLSSEFKGFELGAMWDDCKYIGGHTKSFNKIALVGGPKWIAWTTKLFGHFVKAELKTFNEDELEKAWEWIEAK